MNWARHEQIFLDENDKDFFAQSILLFFTLRRSFKSIISIHHFKIPVGQKNSFFIEFL